MLIPKVTYIGRAHTVRPAAETIPRQPSRS
jgi:hypothetical protein